MQRVSALLPGWDRNRNSSSSTNSKTSLDKVRGWADKIPSPNNRLSVARLGKEPLSPATLDKECEKAARILKSFCCDGFLVPDERPSSPSTTSSSGTTDKVLKKIPPRIVQNAVGLAIFTSMRSGLWAAGSGGSGILIARKTDGTWSPPSGFMLQTAALGFILGVDVYDCVIVINTFTMLEAFGGPKVILGTDVRLVGGPLVSLGLLENEVKWVTDLSDHVLTYVRAKGKPPDVRLDGTVLSHRADENERFYGSDFSVPKILAGDVNQSLPQLRPLTEMLKAAEGRIDYDHTLVDQLASEPAPADVVVESPSSAGSTSPAFGIPDTEDPDPYGVLALEMAGMEIREAGTRLRPDSSQFEYCPSPMSPVFPRIGRRSVDTSISRSNRGSYMSNKTVATERSHMTDAGTQTGTATTPETTPSPSHSDDGHPRHSGEMASKFKEPVEVDYTKIDMSALRNLTAFPDLEEEEEEPVTVDSTEEVKDNKIDVKLVGDHDDAVEVSGADLEVANEADADDDEFEDAEEEEPVVYEVAQAQAPARASQAISMKGAVVTIPRRVPPPLPVRSPARMSRRSKSEFGDVSMVSSPLRQEFEVSPPVEEATTPKAAETFAAATSDIQSPSSDKQEKPIDDVERSDTPTPVTANHYSDKVEDELLAEAVITSQTLSSEMENVDLNSSNGVTVSVA